jgi:hypothetical protein
VRRPTIPLRLEAELMFANDHTCCLCRTERKHVVFHHIDSDRTNNTPENLAVMCLDCHSKVTGASGLGRKFTSLEVKLNKRSWEYTVRKKRGVFRHRIGEREPPFYMRTEIRRIIYELAVTKEIKIAKDRIELLWIYHILEAKANSSLILDTLYDVIYFLADNKGGSIAAEFVPRLFYGLPDPKEIKITRKNIEDLDIAINLLTELAEFSGEFIHNERIPKSCLNALYELFVTALSYGLRITIQKILKAIKKIAKSAKVGAKEDKKMASVVNHANQIERRVAKNMSISD